MGKPRTSRIWTISKSELERIVANVQTYKEVLKKCDLYPYGGNVKTLRSRLTEENISISHFDAYATNRGQSQLRRLTDAEYFTKGHVRSSPGTKKRLITDHGWENKCKICDMGTVWHGKPLSLQIDHIDGDHENNKITNLQILCPNCHTQTSTFGSKNKERKIKQCMMCKKKVYKKSKRCVTCHRDYRTALQKNKGIFHCN